MIAVSAPLTAAPRIALAGVLLESNAFAPPAREGDFRDRYYFQGSALLAEARAETSIIPREMSAFVQAMDATGPWVPLPSLLTGCQPSGPVEQGFLERCIRQIEADLQAAGPLDGVYLALHGAMVATEDLDPDGALLARVRALVGPQAIIVATLDLHSNLSERMVASADLLIGYLTNPHLDMVPRGQEAAFTLRRLLASGRKPAKAFVRLPLTPPSVTLLTAEGPYAELIATGQRRQNEFGGAILNVTVLGGFAFSDSSKTGLSVLVTAQEDPVAAETLALELASQAWRNRGRFRRRLTSVAQAVDLAREATAQPAEQPAVLFSDAGDNPGGGGGGNTLWLLQALVEAGVERVLYGSVFDPELAEEARRQGFGARFQAVFNRHGESEFAKTLTFPAEVVALREGAVVGRLGLFAGRRLELGKCALLRIAGVEVVVISDRQQTADPVFFEMFGRDPGQARVVAVKSRGHFRAGFAPWFSPAQVYEVDTPGLTAPVLERFSWRHLPRPSYPLDRDTIWTPQVRRL
ncbi:M81 family metallopeptidase [Algihabitans albus]|uniref:M81 family metallopeptidase n=1 Tax=Algihabitans albus TaxID=2164067 RepID=UPI000E5C6823|nr:M81 family metallopeptidase [Algihabitans albus]